MERTNVFSAPEERAFPALFHTEGAAFRIRTATPKYRRASTQRKITERATIGRGKLSTHGFKICDIHTAQTQKNVTKRVFQCSKPGFLAARIARLKPPAPEKIMLSAESASKIYRKNPGSDIPAKALEPAAGIEDTAGIISASPSFRTGAQPAGGLYTAQERPENQE